MLAPTLLRRPQVARFMAQVLWSRWRGEPIGPVRDLVEYYGPAIRLRSLDGWLGRGTRGMIGEVWVITSPALIESILIRQHRCFRKDPLTLELGEVIGDSLLVSDADRWKQEHALVQPVMTAGAIRRRERVIMDIVQDTLPPIPTDEPIEATRWLGPITLEVVARTMMGESLADHASDIRTDLDDVMHYYAGVGARGVRPPPSWPTPSRRRFERASRRLRSVTQTIIERRAARPCRPDDPDALGRLIAAHRHDPEDLSSTRVENLAMTLMLAGHETTTLGLAYALHALAANPRAQARWHREVDEQARGGLPEQILEALPWVRAVWRESLRMFPPAPGVGRLSKRWVDLPGLQLPPRTLVAIPAAVMHRMSRWFPDPDSFRPERWLTPPTWPRLVYLPFGAGPRVCVGAHLADLEAQIVLATLARRYALEPVRGHETLRFSLSITTRPRDGVWLRLRSR